MIPPSPRENPLAAARVGALAGSFQAALAARDDGLRFSLHAYNTEAECDAVAQQLGVLLEGGTPRA